jgi:diguanylate cyclase (GGDEF)-like protein/PAS domain S-box-containing protein
MPSSKYLSSPFIRSLWQSVAVLILFVITFIFYVDAEKQIDCANETRLHSIFLADELRQSSDDLTRMVRTYAATGNPIYKKHYQEILNIRNGKQPRPLNYQNIYWDLVELDDKRPRPHSNNTIPLIDMMHQAGFTDTELAKLTEAKNNSDSLTQTEFTAMALIETKPTQRLKALEILHDEKYHQAKLSIMNPIEEFYNLMADRTSGAVQAAEKTALMLRVIFSLTGILLLLMLWRLHKTLHSILGSSVDELHAHITYIGRGDFSYPIPIDDSNKESVFGWLSETQLKLKELIANNERLKNLYSALSQCNQAIVRASDEEELFPIICHDAIHFGGMKMAWIGMLDETSQHLKPVSFYGEGTDYLEDLFISIDPKDPNGQGPTGKAFHKNESIWCQDFQNDPSTAKWHAQSQQHGWGSSAALPLRRNGIVVGIFSLYAERANAFDEAARKLLEEMAMDISYALESFEREFARESAELSLETEKEIAQNYLDIVGVMIMVLDNRKNVKLINRRGCEIIGYPSNEIIGKNWVENFLPERLRREMENIGDILLEQKKFEISTFENPIITKSGEERLMLWNNTPLFDADGNNIGILTSGEDITERRTAEGRIQYLANYDELTGLPNRSKLDNRIQYLLSLAKRNEMPITVMFLDLDHFKDINDTLGHSVGDTLLIEASKRLQSILREEDTVARFGGDEFIVLLPNIEMDGATQVAQKLQTIFQKPFQINEHELSISTSIGIALYPNDGSDFETLYKNADTAMYRAKQEGRNGFCFFTTEMQLHSIRNLELGNALRHALDRDQLHLHYQPQFSTKNKMIIGAEALLRWSHPELGNISPAEFIPISEENGTILAIGEWVLRSAVQTARNWMDQGYPPIIMAVNLSAVQFRSPNLPALVASILQDVGLPPEYLELELTESIAMHDPQRAINTMNDLHARGIRMSIDDFGTGYSSLSYLKKFNIYKLKIDQSFVRDINIDPEDKAIVAAIISMAKSLGLQTIAEGVETIAQLDYLREQECNEIQGYYFSKPLPKEAFEAFRDQY